MSDEPSLAGGQERERVSETQRQRDSVYQMVPFQEGRRQHLRWGHGACPSQEQKVERLGRWSGRWDRLY